MLAFFLSPLGRKVAGGIAVLLLLGGAVWYIYGKGRAAGYVDGQRAQLDVDKQQFQQERAEFLKQLQHYQEADDAAKAQVARKDAELQSLRNSRALIRSNIAAVPAPALVADIQSRLGSVPSGTLSEAELRHLDETVADYQNLSRQVAALEAKSAAQDQRIDAISHQRDSAITAYNNLVPLYSKAYNAAQGKRFSLWRVPPFKWLVPQHKLNLPDPVTLKGISQ